MELWTHPIFSGKWKALVKKVEFLRQPTRGVFSGSVAPLYHLKSLVLVTVSGSGMCEQPCMVQWRPTIADFDSGPAIF
eukprot:7794306-Pyramimonas_sp.AAC.1